MDPEGPVHNTLCVESAEILIFNQRPRRGYRQETCRRERAAVD